LVNKFIWLPLRLICYPPHLTSAQAGAGKEVVATARILAIIYYKMVSNQKAFNPKTLDDYQEKYKQKKINQLKKIRTS